MSSSFWEKYAGWVLVGVSLVVGLWFINQPYVTFTDELLFEEASWRMADGEGWLVPRLHEAPWLEKAPGYFWITGGVFKILSLTPLPVMDLTQSLDENNIYEYAFVRRVVTVVASSVVMGMTYLIAKELWDWRYGLAAGVIMLASALYLFTPLSASLDMTSTAWMCVSIWGYLRYIKAGDKTTSKESVNHSQMLRADQDDAATDNWKWALVMGVSLAGAVMTRSVLGLTPLAVIVVDQSIRIIRGSVGRMRMWDAVWGMGIFALLVIPWHWYMWEQFGTEWLNTYLGFNVVARTTGVIDGYADRSWGYFLWRLVVMTPGWVLSLVLLGSWLLHYLYKSPIEVGKAMNVIGLGSVDKFEMTGISVPETVRVILLWLLIPLVIFSMSATRLDWYAVQLLPSLAVLGSVIGIWLFEWFCKPESRGIKRYLIEIFGIAILLTPMLTLFLYQGTQAAPVQAMTDLLKVTDKDAVVYAYKRAYLPNTLLYHPRQTEIMTKEGLEVLGRETTNYMFVTAIEYKEVESARPDAEVWREYNGGLVYVFR